MKFKLANKIVQDGTSRFASSHLGLFCLPMSHEKGARLIWVKTVALSTKLQITNKKVQHSAFNQRSC